MQAVDELLATPGKEIPSPDRKLLELAAYSLGARFEEIDGEGYGNLHYEDGRVVTAWNPLQFNGDTFEMAVTLGILCMNDRLYRMIVEEQLGYERVEATRRAFTRIAAEIGKLYSV